MPGKHNAGGCGCCGPPPPECPLCTTCQRAQIEVALSQAADGVWCSDCEDWFQAENIIVDEDYGDVCEWGTSTQVNTATCEITSYLTALLQLIDNDPGITVRLTVTFWHTFGFPSYTYYQTIVWEYTFESDPIDCCEDLDQLALAFVSQTGSTNPPEAKATYGLTDTQFCDFSSTTATLYPITPT